MPIFPSNILIDKTIEKFGYDPSLFKGKESYTKLVVCSCRNCDRTTVLKFAAAKRRFNENKKCLMCSNAETSRNNAESRIKKIKDKWASGELIHPMKDKHHTQETKDHLSILYKDKSFEERFGKTKAKKIKKKLSKSQSGENNGFFGKKHNEKSLTKMRKTAKKNARRGKESNFYGKKYWPKRQSDKFVYADVRFRSIWEVDVAKYLDKNNIKWEFESKLFEINDNTYTPDFYLPEEHKLIEVKGYWYKDAIDKFNKFKEIYPDIKIEIWDETKLKELKIINEK